MKVFGNTKTKVAHRAGKNNDACRQSAMKRDNVLKFADLAEAKGSGYRACKRCKPE